MVPRKLLVLALLIVLGACRHDDGTYELVPVSLSLTATSQQTVTAAVIDRRPYVLNGDESPSFLGTERANWGGTKDIKTGSGRSLADEVGDAVVRALENQGVAASALQPAKGADAAEMLALFQAQGADRLLMVELQDWRTDVYTRVKLRWRLEAIVYDRSGDVLGRSDSQGFAPVSRTDLKGQYAILAADELSEKLSNLLNERTITDALR